MANSWVKVTIIAVTALAIVLIAGCLIWAVISWKGGENAEITLEVFKLTYQFLLLVVVGGVVSWLFSQYSKGQEARAKEKEKQQTKRAEERIVQRKFYEDFIEAYNTAKKVRRLLRAKARSNARGEEGVEVIEVIRGEPYDTYMQTLMDIQLRIEFLKEQVQSDPKLFLGATGTEETKSWYQERFAPCLSSIASYLLGIVHEYEEHYHSFNGADLMINELPNLQEFILPHHDEHDKFMKEFWEPAHEVMESSLKLVTSEAPEPNSSYSASA